MAALDQRVVSVWRWSAILTAAPILIAAGVIGWFVWSPVTDLPLFVFYVPLSAVAVGVALVAWLLPPLKWRHWSYEVGDEALQFSHGAVFRSESVVPWTRVQHVDISHGPLDRRFGLSQLKIHTASASTDATLPGLAVDYAEVLREEILAKYKESVVG